MGLEERGAPHLATFGHDGFRQADIPPCFRDNRREEAESKNAVELKRGEEFTRQACIGRRLTLRDETANEGEERLSHGTTAL